MRPTSKSSNELDISSRWSQIAVALLFVFLVAALGIAFWYANPVTAQESGTVTRQTDREPDGASAAEPPQNVLDESQLLPTPLEVSPGNTDSVAQPAVEENQVDSITFGGGCFWCTEAVFQELEGVLSVESGYSNGLTENPTYRDVCSGTTGHAEVIRINYDPAKVEFATLLEVFFKTHDPTTLNRQGADLGTQYRSGVFYHSDAQRETAELIKMRLSESGAYSSPIVTEITPIASYYPAEDYHQNYFRLNGGEGYCRSVIQPKMEKFRQAFVDKLKNEPVSDANQSPADPDR